jgi:uncharacterized protein YbjT (DUF2867 family)
MHPAEPAELFAGGALLAGATGLVGREIARQWPGPGTLHLLVRRPLAAGAAPPGQQVHVVDFQALPALPPVPLAFCALGTTLAAAGSQAAFRAVDFDAVLAFARAARSAGVTRFVAISAHGADPRSHNFYSRVKGEAEAALSELGFRTLLLARPSLLLGDRGALGQPVRRAEALAQALSAPLAWLVPAAVRPIEARRVAAAVLHAVQEAAPGVQRLTSAQMQQRG